MKNTSQKTADETSISTIVMSGPQGDKILEHVHVLLYEYSGQAGVICKNLAKKINNYSEI